MRVTQLVFVGHHKERLLESIRALKLPVEKIVLFVGEEEISGEEKVRRVAEELRSELKSSFEVEIAEINKRNLMKAVVQLLEIIRTEKALGREVIINASGSLRILAIAGYIAGCVAKCRVFTSIPKYDENFEEIGIEQIIEIPILPIDFPIGEQLRALSAIDGGLNSLDELVIKLNPSIDKNSREFFNERSRLSHLVSRLEAMGLIKREKVGRNVRIYLTELGKILAEVKL
ncbi:MAG: DUF6293 family protein [Archaeoglobaceae archaeon]